MHGQRIVWGGGVGRGIVVQQGVVRGGSVGRGRRNVAGVGRGRGMAEQGVMRGGTVGFQGTGPVCIDLRFNKRILCKREILCITDINEIDVDVLTGRGRGSVGGVSRFRGMGMMAEQGYVRGGRVGTRLGGTGSVYINLYFKTGKCCRSEISVDKMFLFTVRGREVGRGGRGLDRPRSIDVRQPTQEQRAAV